MLKLLLIRHSITYGNAKGRYIGVTDESLCQEGIQLLQGVFYPDVEEIFISPMRRCVETARIIYPKQRYHIMDELAECDFGDFENKNYLELEDSQDYQKWIDSEGTLPFPNGESREAFRWRCLKGFQKVAYWCIQNQVKSAALVVHGGTIMNIMEEYASPQRDFYDWKVKNGCGYAIELNPELWRSNREEIRIIARIPYILEKHTLT